MNRQDILELRRQARAQKLLRDQDLLSLHIRAADAMENPQAEAKIRAQALDSPFGALIHQAA